MRNRMFLVAVPAALVAVLFATSSASAQNTMGGEVSGSLYNGESPTVFNGSPQWGFGSSQQWGGSQWNTGRGGWGNSQWNVQGSGPAWGGAQWGDQGVAPVAPIWGGGYGGGYGGRGAYDRVPSLSNSAPGGNAQFGTPFYNHTRAVAAASYGNVGNYGSTTGPLFGSNQQVYPSSVWGAASPNYGSTNGSPWNPAYANYGAPINGAPNFGTPNFSAPNSGTGTYGGYYSTASPITVPMAPVSIHR